MAITVFPAAVTSTLNASAITAVSANTMYEGRATFDSAIYTVTCASGVITNFQFFNGTTSVLSSVTASGTVSINLASTADRVRLYTNTGSNTVVSITKTAAALTNQFSGTLDTVTTTGSSTYTGTSTSGYGYAMIVGPGGGSGGTSGSDGGGGGGGGVAGKFVVLTGSMAVVIGTAGAARTTAGGPSSTFAGMTATTGAGGVSGGGGAGGVGGTGSGGDVSTTGTTGLNGGTAATGGSPSSTYPFVASTIGTGGGYNSVGTGYGAGGGGGGVAGTQGVLYVLRF